jgi:hypothetical protein
MEQLHIDRLKTLIEFMKQLPPEKFDISTWVSKVDVQSNSVCAIGWMPVVFPNDWRYFVFLL